MSLQVWLPLTGDLHNQGLGGPLNFTISGTITDVDGKIGKAKHFSSAMVRAPYNFTLGDKFSFSAWIYWDSFRSDNEWIIELGKTASGYDNALFGFNTTKGKGKNTVVAIGGNYVTTLTGDFQTKQWFHVAVTWNGSIVKLYSNGVLIDSTSLSKGSFINSTNISLACNVANSGTKFTGSLNDVRVYDHCLSDKEVEEISKGLILHYPLNNNGMGGENLFRGSAMSTADRVGLTNNKSTNWTKYFRIYNGSTSIHSFSGDIDTISLNSSGNLGICFQRKATDISLDSTSYYIISCEAKCNKVGAGLDIGLSYYDTSDNWVWRGGTNRQLFNNTTDWQKFTLKFKPDADTQYIMYCFSVVGKSGGTETFSIRHCKLEKGEKATAWAPSSLDSSYPENYKTIIYDTSGYSNNGIIVGELSAAAPSPRYNVCTVFNKNSYIKNIDFSYESNQWSVSLWYFKTIAPSGYESLFCFSKGNGGDSNKKMAIIPNSSYIWFKCESGTGTLSSVKVNEWTHIVLTSEGKAYENGIEVLTIIPGSVIAGCTDVAIGARAAAENATSIAVPFEGKISDVRIYATALTAAQVSELYNQSMIIDASGNILPRELVN